MRGSKDERFRFTLLAFVVLGLLANGSAFRYVDGFICFAQESDCR